MLGLGIEGIEFVGGEEHVMVRVVLLYPQDVPYPVDPLVVPDCTLCRSSGDVQSTVCPDCRAPCFT